jgi:hypothetical protein
MTTRIRDQRFSDATANPTAAVRAALMVNAAAPLTARESRPPLSDRAIHPEAFRRIEDRQYLDMSRAFETRGGWVSGDEMSRHLRRHWDQPISVLANWVMNREIVNIVWHGRILVPVFQFSSEDLQIRPLVRAALAELVGVFDDWEIAVWFTQPNAWLHEQPPLDLVARGDNTVIEAARADRFIARN